MHDILKEKPKYAFLIKSETEQKYFIVVDNFIETLANAIRHKTEIRR